MAIPLAVAAETLWGPYAAPVFLTAGLGILLGALLLERWLPTLISGVVLALLAWPHLLDHPVVHQPVRIYLVDLIVACLAAAAGLAWLRRPTRLPTARLFFLLISVAGLLTVLGLSHGHAVRDVAGTLRRIGLYGVMLLVAAQAFSTGPAPWDRLRRAILVAGGAGAMLALYRLATGAGYMEAYMAANHVPSRYLSYLEALGPLLAALLLLDAPAQEEPLRRRLVRSLALVVMVLALLVSNYRAVWLAFGVGVVVRMLAVGGGTAMRRLVPLGFALGGVSAVVAGLLAVLSPENSPLARFSIRNLRGGMSWRTGSWTRAWEVFWDSPVTGVGLGYRHRFTYLTGPQLDRPVVSDGASIHNDLLWLLANGGLLLTGTVVLIHAVWIRRLATTPSSVADLPLRGALVGGYAALVVLAMLQPVLSHPSSAVLLYTLIGMTFAAAGSSTRGDTSATKG